MPRYVAFLRGINLGKRRLSMSRLKALFEEIGFDDVETFIASGNVLFSSKARDAGRLDRAIAKHLESALGYDVDTFLRTAAEVVTVGKFDAFDGDVRNTGTVNVGFSRAASACDGEKVGGRAHRQRSVSDRRARVLVQPRRRSEVGSLEVAGGEGRSVTSVDGVKHEHYSEAR